MASLWDHIIARIAWIHADRVFRGFHRTLADVERVQHRTLREVMALLGPGDLGRRLGLHRVRTPDDLRRAAPLHTYEDLRPHVERVMNGEVQALFAPGTPIQMFATSSGTTAKQKFIPVTPAFVRHYRRGWNTFGLNLLRDHPDAILRAILQSTGRYDASQAPSGVPCGAITGLLARTQKGIVRRFYVGRPEIAELSDPLARYYALMRLGAARDVAFAITANPATLIRMALHFDDHGEAAIRDIRDGTLSRQQVGDEPAARTLALGLRPDPRRAAELEQIRSKTGTLRPRDYWRMSFLACWTGGSMGHYLPRLAEWYGPIPVRDIGLLASEGRVSIPLSDGVPAGPLDLQAAVFEFIPNEEVDAPQPRTLWPHELEVGRRYAVVLTNHAGLLRYRLDDVVEVTGMLGRTPMVAFLHRAGRVSSLAGEKLTEHQVVEAVRTICTTYQITHFDFVAAPVWDDPPYYRLNTPHTLPAGMLAELDAALGQFNDEYESRRKSNRIGPLRVRTISPDLIPAMDLALMRSRHSTAEQYKRPSLLTTPGDDDRLLPQG